MLFAINAMAQLTNLEKKKLKLMALEVVLKYESAASVSNDDLKDDFIKLFDDIDVEVLNDVLPDNGLDTKVAVKNYIDIIPAYFTYSLKISVVPYEVELIDENSREVLINVSAKKTISGTENKTQLLYFDTLDIDFGRQLIIQSSLYSPILSTSARYSSLCSRSCRSLVGRTVIR